jgi:hypothetical protein
MCFDVCNVFDVPGAWETLKTMTMVRCVLSWKVLKSQLIINFTSIYIYGYEQAEYIVFILIFCQECILLQVIAYSTRLFE